MLIGAVPDRGQHKPYAREFAVVHPGMLPLFCDQDGQDGSSAVAMYVRSPTSYADEVEEVQLKDGDDALKRAVQVLDQAESDAEAAQRPGGHAATAPQNPLGCRGRSAPGNSPPGRR
ncbi:hypothetical protein OIE63_20885 [Streptomyces sp. NBC_01795]|uniref:hypothetical protein n=1 Tax=Streptomyces sp. NBC_01795 TaxID=2975943 RepID=UPI002DDB8D9E|nr:hypothetical protein [Streptomyces sp. NBC_01795]WSA93762.1 hypothetical protein OIE63_20885 [Streptomyces sp. NBC_01795]